ncbi:MAG: putative replicase protein [Litlevirus faecicola]|uniref:RNA-directed RNA polymerase n=1 Tax=Leviviridae sp. TaxID=2027243 RepID=A0ABY3SVB1_9VIRU|nr:MAG: putative replicase protein [Leviviridae sp.]
MLLTDQQEYLFGLYRALSKDCAREVPGLHEQELERDVSRLLSCVKHRGSRVLTIDLPDMGKHFDLCLSTGRLTKFPGPLARTRNKASSIPRLFWGLMVRVFDDHGVLRATPCTVSIRFLRQFYYLAKKWKVQCDESYTYNEVRDFYRVDQQLRHPTLQWGDPDLYGGDRFAHNDSFVDGTLLPWTRDPSDDLFGEGNHWGSVADAGRLLAILQRVCDSMSSALGVFEVDDWLPQHGPGAVSDRLRNLSKYEFPNWPERLESVFPSSRFAFANEGVWSEELLGESLHSRFEGGETYSKLIAVPKTQKGPRLIAAEPTCNLWCQQVIRKYLMSRTRSSWLGRMINFNDQTPNQELALAASHSGLLATVDLKAASDRMSCWVVERAFRGRRDLLEALNASRTCYILNSIDKKSPMFYKLRKLSTMGSAITFPIQSLVFASIALASLMYEERTISMTRMKALSRLVRVFGDDIIVPTHSLGTLRQLLKVLGFEVNPLKTFGTGKFRESCGVDAYDGVDVTPAYALSLPTRSKPESVMSAAAQAHNFALRNLWFCAEYHEWSARERGLGLDLPYVTPGSGNLGWPSVLGESYDHLEQRWNKDLWRLEARMRVLSSRSERKADRGASRLLQYFVEEPPVHTKWTGGYDVRSVVMSRPRWVPIP